MKQDWYGPVHNDLWCQWARRFRVELLSDIGYTVILSKPPTKVLDHFIGFVSPGLLYLAVPSTKLLLEIASVVILTTTAPERNILTLGQQLPKPWVIRTKSLRPGTTNTWYYGQNFFEWPQYRENTHQDFFGKLIQHPLFCLDL
eukprot:scaffold6829_cov171-Amphora_coffeaeformis.AAC.13